MLDLPGLLAVFRQDLTGRRQLGDEGHQVVRLAANTSDVRRDPGSFARTDDRWGLSQHVLNHPAVHERQALFGAVVEVAEAVVIEPEQMQDRSVQFIDAARVFHGLVTEFVRGAIAGGPLDAGPGQPHGKPLGIVIAALRTCLEGWHPAELGTPHNQRIVEHAAGLQVLEQRRGGLIEDRGMHRILILDRLVAIPVADSLTHRVGAVEQLDETDAPLEQAPGEQAIAGEAGLDLVGIFSAIGFVRGRCLAREVRNFRALSCSLAASS